MIDRENDLNLIISEPPLKKFKKQIAEKLSKSSENVSSVVFPELQLQQDDSIIESPKESTLEKWRKSFQSSSTTLEAGMKEIELLSDGFFDTSINGEEDFDFDVDVDVEGLTEIDQEEIFSSSRYESVQNHMTI